MFVSIVDRIWVSLGVERKELRRERGRGLVYAMLFTSSFASVILATDLILNLSGRFG